MAGSDFTLRPFLWRAVNLFSEKQVVSRSPDGVHRYTYDAFGDRVAAFANALRDLGVGPGDRVGTFGWNHHRHLEAYFAVPLLGAQLHTINVQLPDEHVEYIVEDAADDLLLVDPGAPLETIECLWTDLESVESIVVMGEGEPGADIDDARGYEPLQEDADSTIEWPDLPGDQPAGMCYTSGTTGLPKGVEYTHEMLYAHTMMTIAPDSLNLSEQDVVMPVVPMFHVNGWELPYATTMVGSKQVHPGPSPDAADLAALIESEGVTFTAGVPTVWINLLEYLEDHDADISSLDRILSGGSAVPEGIMRRYDREYDVTIDHAWGMTETMSVGSYSRPKATMAEWDRQERFAVQQKQGLLSPGLEMNVVDDHGEEVPWDGESFGELWVRGPTVVDEYHDRPEATENSFEGNWLKTGDIVTVDEYGYIEVVDRSKDVIKSGGEWISTIELENALMAHDAVAEAAVVGLEDDRWQERPVAFVAPVPGAHPSAETLRAFLEDEYPRWWLPDNVVTVEAVPKTATGKFDKKVLRDEYGDVDLPWTPGS